MILTPLVEKLWRVLSGIRTDEVMHRHEKIMQTRKGNILLTTLLVLFCTSAQSAIFPHDDMVVTSQHLATQVGYDVLNKGGNAVDAAVAVGYALSVVEPCCGNIGGGGFMVIRFKNKPAVVLNFREKAPIHASVKLYLDKHGHPIPARMSTGYLPVAVPGTVMGLNTALKKYGTFSLREVIAPSIRLAQEGFTLVPGDVAILQKQWAHLRKHPNVVAIFGRDAKPLQAGDRLVQKELGHTLETIAEKGTDAFYRGVIADRIVKASQKHGGVLTKQDFLDYTVEIQKPIRCDYRGYEVISAPPPSSGGVVLCEILNITAGYPLSTLGYRKPQGTHYILEAMRFAYADRNQSLGDPDFVSNPIDKLLSSKHAAAIRRNIKPNKVTSSLMIEKQFSEEKPQTTHYSIVDKEGNAVSVTYTINGYFGSTVIAPGTGFFLNNEMDDFALQPGAPNEFQLIQGSKNAIQPQKRPLSSMTPTIVLKDKQLFMVLGAPGGSTIPTQVLETIENVIDYHQDLQQAVDAPRYHMQWLPDLVFMERHAFTASTLKALKQMGYHFQLGSPFNTPIWGAVAAILQKPESEKLIGAIDKRRPEGLALGHLH